MESAQHDDDDGVANAALADTAGHTGTHNSHSETEEIAPTMVPSGAASRGPGDAEIEPRVGASTSLGADAAPVSPAINNDDGDDPFADMLGQLQLEMAKRRPDRFLVGVLCRSLGGVPPAWRTKIWQELLGVARNERLHLDQSILAVEEDLVNQRVIAADACRTRGNDELFKQPATIDAISKILTFYCKSRNIRYKQGMNEVLAPFLMLERPPQTPLPEGLVFQLFYAMIDKFLPHVFVDRDFKSLQCSFQLFRLLMLYHDPKLCNYLDQHAMTPELYVTPWFMTLFARGLAEELVFTLWDFFLLHEDPYLLHYVAYALVETYRDEILQADVSMLPQVLSNISLESRERVDTVCAAALELMETTPRSYRRDLYSVCYGGYTNAMVPFLRQLMSASSLQVYPDELLSNLLSRLGQTNGASPAAAAMRPHMMPELTAQKLFSAERDASLSSVFFIVLDCRPLEQYRECHLSLSYHVDPDIVGSPDALSVLLKGFTRMKGCHFCFVGPIVGGGTPGSKHSGGLGFETINRITRGLSGERAQLEAAAAASASNSSLLGVGTNTVPFLKKEHITVTRLVLMFLQKGFEHVSRLDGGFDELKLEIEKLDQFAQDQLLVYEEAGSTETNVNEKAAGGLKLFAKKTLDRVRTLSDDDPSTAVVSEASSDSLTGAPPALSIKTKTKATVTTLSQRLQILTSAAKDAVAASAAGKVLQSPPPHSSFVTQERSVVGEDEWMEVYTRTREALEKSLTFKEVVFQAGSLGILFQRSRHKKYLTVVDSLVPESQASESQQVEPGDLLVAVNGQDIAGIAFQDVIDMIKDARRPLVLRLQNPKKKNLDTFDTISIPPLPPIMISASHHSICVSWNKLAMPNERYQLQYAKQSDYNFNPWLAVPMKHESNATEIDRTSGVTTHHNGTLVGLEPGVALVFRVRCGNNDKWGPYSLSSGPMATLEKGDEEIVSSVPAAEASVTSPTSSAMSPRGNSAAVFLPGECPEFFERGTFFFRVVVGLRARATPAFDGEKLEVVLERGAIIKCSERLVSPGTNQIFVRLCRDWNVAQRKPKTPLRKKDSEDDDRRSISASDESEEFEVWAFENTPEGACVLERLPEFTEEMIPTAVPLQEQAKSLVSSFFSASGIKAPGSAASAASTASSSAAPSCSTVVQPVSIPSAPRIVGVAAASSTEIKLTWEPVNDPSVTKYQIQYAKNRLTASWLTLKEDISAAACTHTLSELLPNVGYVFRVRAADDSQHWGPFSETSEPCKTMEEKAVMKPKEDDTSDEATTPRGPPPARDQSEMIDSATTHSNSSSSFSSFFTRSTSASSMNSNNRQASQPLRTGSTLLDKAVAAASKLTLTRAESGRRRRSSAAAPPTFEEMLEAVLPAEGDLIDVEEWKAELARVDPSSHSFQSVRYIPTVVVTSEPASSAQDIDPFAAIAASKVVALDTVDPSVLESAAAQLTWNRVGERELVVTQTALLVLAKPSSHGDAPDAVVETRRSLSALARITSKKTVTNSVVFHFKRELTEMEKVARTAEDDAVAAPLEQLCFVVEDKATCVALVKENYTPDDSPAS